MHVVLRTALIVIANKFPARSVNTVAVSLAELGNAWYTTADLGGQVLKVTGFWSTRQSG
jgi:hypothetical protein